jgi:hypothetical protein
MKLGTRPQIWLVGAVAVATVVYLPYRMWSTRDITWHWKDEVQLADGSRVWVVRSEVREILGGGEPFSGPARTTKVARLELPGVSSSVVWEHRMEPLIVALGVNPVQWVVIAKPIWCNEYRDFGSPSPPYIQFEYADGKWGYQAVESRWYGKGTNLLVSTEQREAHDGVSVKAEKIPLFNYRIHQSLQKIDLSAKMNCENERNYRNRR